LAANPGVNIALSLLLIPYWGPIGAAVGRVGGVAVSAALRHTLIVRAMTGVHWLRFAAKPALISIGAGTLSYLLFDHRPGLALLFYGAVTAVLLRLAAGLSPAVVKDMMSPSSSPR
jgi:O-antigen/teichoic acid export membrane protein